MHLAIGLDICARSQLADHAHCDAHQSCPRTNIETPRHACIPSHTAIQTGEASLRAMDRAVSDRSTWSFRPRRGGARRAPTPPAGGASAPASSPRPARIPISAGPPAAARAIPLNHPNHQVSSPASPYPAPLVKSILDDRLLRRSSAQHRRPRLSLGTVRDGDGNWGRKEGRRSPRVCADRATHRALDKEHFRIQTCTESIGLQELYC